MISLACRIHISFSFLFSMVVAYTPVAAIPGLDWCSQLGLEETKRFPNCKPLFSTKTSKAEEILDWRSYLAKNQSADSDDGSGTAANSLFEGDILNYDKGFNVSAAGTSANAVLDPNLKWPNGIVPYVVSNAIPPADRKILRQAMETFHKKTCLRFIPRTRETDFISIESKDGCNSYIGKVGGMQPVSLQVGQCFKQGKVEHELMHVLGFTHEHSRSDRDQHIAINWNNISPDLVANFQSYSSSVIDSLGAEYDYGSIMHYGPFYFALDPNVWTMVPRIKGKEIGQRRMLSNIDLWKINKLYHCPQFRQSPSITSSPPNPVIVQCALGWSKYRNDCFYVSVENGRDATSWADAKDICEAQLGNLALIDDEATNKFLASKFRDTTDAIWIGARQPDAFRWFFRGSSKEIFYSNWADGQPNSCTVMNTEGKWLSANCDSSYNFICQRPLVLPSLPPPQTEPTNPVPTNGKTASGAAKSWRDIARYQREGN